MSDVIDLYLHLMHNDGDDDPQPLNVTLTTRTAFSRRLASLRKAAEEDKGLSAVVSGAWKDEPAGEDDSEETLEEEEVQQEEGTVQEELEEQQTAPEPSVALAAAGVSLAAVEGNQDNDFVENDDAEDGLFSEDELNQADENAATEGLEQAGDETAAQVDGQEPTEELEAVDAAAQDTPKHGKAPAKSTPPDYDDNIIDFSDEEDEAEDDTTRSSTVQGEPTTAQNQPEVSASNEAAKPASIGDDLTATAAQAEAGDRDAKTSDNLLAQVGSADPQEPSIPSKPTVLEDGDFLDGPVDPTAEDDPFDFATLSDDDLDWPEKPAQDAIPGDDTAAEAAHEVDGVGSAPDQPAETYDAFEDDFLNLDGDLPEEELDAVEAGEIQERRSPSPLGKRSWDEQAEGEADAGTDQEVKRVKST